MKETQTARYKKGCRASMTPLGMPLFQHLHTVTNPEVLPTLSSPNPVNGTPTSLYSDIFHTLFTDLNWHIVTSGKSITSPKSDLLVKVEHKALNMLLMFSGSSQVSVHIMDGSKAFLDSAILRLVLILFFFFGICTSSYLLCNPWYDPCNQSNICTKYWDK